MRHLLAGRVSLLLLLCCACRAVGDAAPAQAVRRLREDNPRFRMLGLSATPGNEHSHIQVRGCVCVCQGRRVTQTRHP